MSRRERFLCPTCRGGGSSSPGVACNDCESTGFVAVTVAEFGDRIVRADENHLTPETRAALTNILRFVDGIFIVGGGHEQIQRDWDVLSSAIGGQT